MTRIVRYENGLCLIENEPEPIDLTAFSWYAGKGTSERAAEKILIGQSKIPGSFLVTDCNVLDIDYMLLVNNGKNIFRLEVRVFPDNSCIIGAESSFDDLPAGIEYYKKHKINGVYLYEELPPPPPAPEAPYFDDDDFSTDIGPPPRVLSYEESQFGPPKVKSKKSVSFKPSGTSTEKKTVTKKKQSVCPSSAAIGYGTSHLDLGSLTSISNGAAISPGLSSFETFKPSKQPSKHRSDTPIKVPQKNKVTGTKATLSGQKSQPASRIPKPTIQFTTKTMQVKPKTKKPAATQLNLSALTSIGDAKPDKEPVADSHSRASSMKSKKVAPPVPPRRSSLSAASYSTASLEKYANELGGTESQDKPQEFTETSDDNLKEDSSTKVQASPKTQATGKGKNKSSLQRGTVIPKSVKPYVSKKMPSSNPIQKSQITKHMSLESIEKDGCTIVRSSSNDSELEEVYKKITKFSWNSNEFSDHVTAPPSNNQ